MSKLLCTLILLEILQLSKEQGTNGLNIDYNEFQRRYRQNGQEQKMRSDRKKIFEKNLQLLKNKSLINPSLGDSKFIDWTQQEKKNFFNFQPPKLQKQVASESKPKMVSSAPKPEYFDYRDLDKIGPAKDQGICGSCWSFAAAGQYQAIYSLQRNSQLDASEQYLIDCIYTNKSRRCTGGDYVSGFRLFNRTGSPTENQYPYYQQYNQVGTDAGYVSAGMCTNTSSYKTLRSFATQIKYSSLTDSQLIDQLLNYGPVAVAVQANVFFQSLKNYPYQLNDCPQNADVDHAVLLVGYTPTHYIIKNSWGTSWGEKGFGYISRYSDCGIKRYVSIVRTGMNVSTYPNSDVKLAIEMTDSFFDGWGFTFGLRQNGTIKGNFTLQPAQSKTIYITIDSRLRTDIVILQSQIIGSWQIGFKIKINRSGRILFQKQSGRFLSSKSLGSIIGSFCPLYCPLQRGTLGSSNGKLLQQSDGQNTQSNEYIQDIVTSRAILSKLQIAMIAVSSTLLLIVIVLTIATCHMHRLNKRRSAKAELQKRQKQPQSSSSKTILQPVQNKM